MEETRSKLNSTQKIVVNLLQQLVTECTDRVPATQSCTVASTTAYRVYRPVTGYTVLYSCFNNCLQSVPTRYRLYSLCTAYPTPPTGYRVIQPSPFNSVLILGQVDSKYLQIWLQLTGYRVFKSPDQFTGYTALFLPKPVTEWSLQPLVTEPTDKVRLYSLASPKLVTESTHLVHSTLLILGQVDVEAFTRITSTDWLRSVPTRCRSTQSLF